MDLLVDLCSQYHLNPSYHTLELLSPEAQPVAFKPNALLGTLDVSCALIKERVPEERVVRKPPPKVPEKTVRLVVNFHRGQKAVVRVNPVVPLQSLVPVICQKCEFDPAHVLLLRDSVSNYELDLRKSLSELDIRELYVLDQKLVLQPKTASAPVLNYSAESLRSNTQSATGVEKKGLLGFFKITRRRSKGLSVVGGPCVEVRPNTLGQSQSAMNLSRVSPKTEPKKRRAPAPPPPPAHTHTAVLASQTKPGSPRTDSQMKKRKAPAPPPTPTPSTPEPVLTLPASVVHVPAQIEGKTVTAQVLSSTPLADDSLSDLSHSIEDSEPAGSICSSSSSDAAAESASSSLAEEPMLSLTNEPPASSTPEPEPEPEANPVPVPRITFKQEPAPSSTLEETEAALELKMEEMENNRHSAIGSGRNVPLKPRRSPLRELKQLTISSPPSSPPPAGQNNQQTSLDMHIETAPHFYVKTEVNKKYTETFERTGLELKGFVIQYWNMLKAWLHSVEQRAEQEVETVSMCSSESLADQGYAASEGMADDSGLLSSPSDLTQPTSPEDIISLNHDPSPTPNQQPKECSSDSDEGCATWGSRHSEAVRQDNQSERRKNSYDENADEITAQVHLTLADLDADLAEVNHADEASACMDDEIPVSVVDVDVPVTAIDEVSDDELSGPSVLQAFCSTQNMNKQDVTGSSSELNVNVQNKNNNAHVSGKASISQLQADQIRYTDEIVMSHDIKGELHRPNVQDDSVSQRCQGPVISSVVQSAQPVAESRIRSAPLVQSHGMKNDEVERALSSRAPTPAQIKITQSPVSRFGLKTFTVIPPKPTVSHASKSAGSLGTGAIKIDELGNMVKKREARPFSAQDKYSHPNEATIDPDSPLLGKAKAFWSSAEKQDPAPAANKGASVKSREAEVPKPVPITVKPHPPEKPSVEEPLKKASGSTNHSESAVMNKLPVSDPAKNSSISEPRKNLFHLKPSRRTSSQYVASAIAKYTGTPSTKANGIQELPESTTDGQRQFASQSFKHESRSNATTNHVPYVAGPKRSQSYPSHITEKQTSTDEPQSSGISKGSLPFGVANTKSLDSSPVNTEPESTQDCFKKYTSAKSTPENPPIKSPTSTTRPPVAKKPEVPSPGVLPSPNQVTVFGPVKKFKPVILKSVEKETSLHSSLMEAIQSGEGIERLRKVSGSSLTSPTKKTSYVETENERSALLSAIRAQSNTRLKKTRSEAAVELEQLKKAEEERATQRNVPSPTPPEFAPPPPPIFAPPPPPPPSAPSKPALVLPAVGNPELAREAMLEAIRSGAGAERLRKVPVTVKTRKVNGRLGIVKAPSSPSQKH
ncbi:hypothetical protein NFI96_018075 [Prochilodus magdalenae]|nr:hypothetical protein NFI96_018075 [Prochilodus magdalenae]